MSRTYAFAKRGASTSQTSYEIRGSDLRLLKSPSVGSTGKRSTGPFSYAVSPRLALILLYALKQRPPQFKSGLLWVTGYKTLWSEAWCISRWYIVPQTIFCTNGCAAGDKVEIPAATVRKSLPKRRKNAGVLTKQKKRTGKSALMVGKEAESCLLFGGKRVI